MREKIVVCLRGMAFHASVGSLPHERELRQPIEIDVEVFCSRLYADDGVTPALDYRDIHALIGDAVGAEHTDFLETIAARIRDSVLQIAVVSGVRVAVRKPHVPLGSPLLHSEVRLEVLDEG